MELFFVLAFSSALICGVLGAFIARLKGVSVSAGIVLGALLGPIGLIIVALLAPQQVVVTTAPVISPPIAYEGERDLSVGKYRLWLVEKYGVTRNEVMNVYAVHGEPFDSLDGAVAYAHELETKHEEERTVAEKKRLDDQEAWTKRREAALAEERASDGMTTRIILVVVGVVVGGLVLFLLVSSFASL